MKSLNELHEIYKKAIDATLFENGNFDAYTPKQQEELNKLNESIERLAEKDLDTEVALLLASQRMYGIFWLIMIVKIWITAIMTDHIKKVNMIFMMF